MKTIYLLIAAIFQILILSGCSKDSEVQVPPLVSISGVIQIGLPLSGDTVILNELDWLLRKTGVSYITRVKNDVGSYTFSNLPIKSQYVSIECKGHAWDFINRKFYNGKINTCAIVEANCITANVNVCTTLEALRVTYLIGMDYTYQDAKKTALTDVLKTFGIKLEAEQKAESASMIEGGLYPSALLAISSLIANDEAKNINTFVYSYTDDIECDGVIDGTFFPEYLSASKKDLSTKISYLSSADGQNWKMTAPKNKIDCVQEEISRVCNQNDILYFNKDFKPFVFN